jgi:hypothetical protein
MMLTCRRHKLAMEDVSRGSTLLMSAALQSEHQEDKHTVDDDVYEPAVHVHPVAYLWCKTLADMIYGLASMVLARGRIARFMIPCQYTAARFRWLQRIVSCSGAVAGHPGDAQAFFR